MASFNGAVHALDLAVGPGMVRFGKSVVDAMQQAGAIEGMPAKAGGWSLSILWKISELDAVVGEHGMNPIRNSRDQRLQEGRGCSHVRALDQFDESELRSAVDSHEEVELVFRGANFRQIDMEVADRIVLELLPSSLVAFDFRQPADAMPFQTAMQRRAGQMRNGSPAKRRGSHRRAAEYACRRQ